MGIKFQCKECGFELEAADQDCPRCMDDNIFSGGQTLERQVIRDRINKVIPPKSNTESDED